MHQYFTENVILNCEIKEGGWRKLHSEGMVVDKTSVSLQESYGLEDVAIECIEFQYKTKLGEKGNSKVVRISEAGVKLEGRIRENDDKTFLVVHLQSMVYI